MQRLFLRAPGSAPAALVRQSIGILFLSWLAWLGCARFVVASYYVEGRCMEPHLQTGARVLGEKWTFRLRPPRRGDVIVFVCPADPGALYIKRVIAVGGETVAGRGGAIYVDGRPLAEPWRVRPAHGGDFAARRVAPHALFVLGDNRDDSTDSRDFGDVPQGAVVARGAWRIGPLARGIEPL